MNTLYIIRKKVFPALLIAALGFSGCLSDGADDITPVPSVEGDGLTLNVSVPGMLSATRAGDNTVSELDIVVFDDAGVFVEHVPANIIATDLGGGSVTQVYAPVTTGAGYTVAVVANFRSAIEATALAGMSKAAFRNLQVKQKADNNFDNILWNFNKAQPADLPMYGEIVLASASSPGEALNVKLCRVHARIDFKMEDADSDIKDIWFRYFQTSGSLAFNGSFQNPGVSGRDIVLYPRLPGASFKSAEGFYVFEEPAQVSDIGNYGFVIVRAKYDGVYYYYRVDFISDGSFPGYAKGEFIPVKRNYRYNVVINEVLGPGYADFSTAGSSKGEVNNLRYTILTEDEEAGHIVYDGNYYLSVDRNEFEVPKLGVADPDVLEVIVRTNYDSSQHTVDAWKVTENDPEITPVGLPVTETMTFFMGPAYLNGKIRFRVAPNPTSQDRVLTFTIEAGKFFQIIRIIQSGTPVNASINTEQLPGAFEYYSWLGVLLEDYNSQLMLDWISANKTVTVETVPETAPVTDPVTVFKPFEFSTAAGFDDITAARTYTGSKKLFNIAPEATSFIYESYPFRSKIRITAKGDNGTVTKEIPVKYKNICVYRSSPDFVYVSSDKLQQNIGMAANTTFTITKTSDPMNVTGYTSLTSTMADMYNNPFDNSGGEGIGSGINFYTKSVNDLGAGCTVSFKMSSPLYNGYGGTKEFDFDIKVVPVGERANSYIIKPGDCTPGIPLSQANQTSELGPNWIDVSAGVSNTKWMMAEIEWSDSPGVVQLVDTPIRYTHEDYVGTPEAYLIVKGLKDGNAVVSVSQWENGAYVKKWSWHIWVTADRDVIGAGAGVGNRWMDRNLGALAATPYVNSVYSEDQFAKTTGLFYQWGRKDAFPAVNQYCAGGTTITAFSNANNALDAVTNAAEAVKNPLKFCSTAFGWEGSGGATSWNRGGKSVYDPCPAGWKLPALSDLPTVPGYGNTITDNMVLHSSLGIKFPLTGYRFRDNLLQAKYEAYIWYNAGYPGHAGQYSANIYGMDTSGIADSTVSVPTFGMMNVRCVRIPL